MDYSNIKGYEKLSERGKGVFNYVNRKHQNGIDKEEWIVTEVKQRATYIKVIFKNGKWLAFYPDGSWS